MDAELKRLRRQAEYLESLLQDAWDALDTSPKHLDVAKERIEMALATLRRDKNKS